MLSDVPRIRARPLFESRHLRQQRRRALSCKSAATAAAGNMSFDVPRPPSRPSSRAGGQSALLARATTPAPGQVIHPFTSAAHFLPLNSRALHRLIILSQCSSCTDTGPLRHLSTHLHEHFIRTSVAVTFRQTSLMQIVFNHKPGGRRCMVGGAHQSLVCTGCVCGCMCVWVCMCACVCTR